MQTPEPQLTTVTTPPHASLVCASSTACMLRVQVLIASTRRSTSLHYIMQRAQTIILVHAGDWAEGNMWSCSTFKEHLDASCAQPGLWENHIQPQMQRIVQYSLACATVSHNCPITAL